MSGPMPTFPCSPNVQIRVECSWCGEEIAPGAKPTSHGICPDCRREHFPDVPEGVAIPCSLCRAPSREGSPYPLCPRCEATARAAGRQAVEAMRYPGPEVRS